jgi:hypothetical protein
MTTTTPPTNKRTYRKPAMRAYGSLAAVTRAVGANGMGDGGGGGATKNMSRL